MRLPAGAKASAGFALLCLRGITAICAVVCALFEAGVVWSFRSFAALRAAKDDSALSFRNLWDGSIAMRASTGR